MIGWSAIKPVLIDVFTEISADTEQLQDGFTAEWKEGKRGFVSPHQRFVPLLKISSVVGIGEDETRYADHAQGLTATQVGQRRFTLQVQIVCPEHTDDQWAMAATERIRTRLMRPRILQQLLAVQVDVRRVEKAVKASFKDHGRIVSAANLDVIMGTVVNDADPIPLGVIEYAVITSHVEDSDGAELPAAQQWVEHEIPTIP